MVTHGRSGSSDSSVPVSGVRAGASGPATPTTLERASYLVRLRCPIMANGSGTAAALLTDRYELTMVGAALADGTAARECVFEVFARRLPHGRRFGVVSGTRRLLELLPD